MDDKTDQPQIRRLERKLNLLLGLSVAQSIALAVLVASQFLWPHVTSILACLALVGFVVLFRKQIPVWFGIVSRYIFAQIFAAQKSDSAKDIR